MHRCRRQPGDGAVATGAAASAGIVASLVAALQRHMRLDWLCTQRDVRSASLARCTWFKGKDPRLGVPAFVARWGPAGLLCSVPDVEEEGEHAAGALSVLLLPRIRLLCPLWQSDLCMCTVFGLWTMLTWPPGLCLCFVCARTQCACWCPAVAS